MSPRYSLGSKTPEDPYPRFTLGILAREHAALIAAGGIVVVEHQKKTPLAERYGALERTRVLQQGDAALSFYAVAETQVPKTLESLLDPGP